MYDIHIPNGGQYDKALNDAKERATMGLGIDNLKQRIDELNEHYFRAGYFAGRRDIVEAAAAVLKANPNENQK
jgi:hypothetical protein